MALLDAAADWGHRVSVERLPCGVRQLDGTRRRPPRWDRFLGSQRRRWDDRLAAGGREGSISWGIMPYKVGYERSPFCTVWWESMSRHERLTTPEGRCRGRCWESRVEFRRK